ncbi:hypothetical protein HMI54_009166 [Coelomomyces lativittatus]|nr:hypothetical protein HMI56_003003 [Coelomomyces lativittatus]KAJ1516518.1 hypothetical protein HMI54_009166 [Coelomomyces lativittatus]KAJ1517555.1 hypothetical protein HMI55_006714 [Coelomomyces lativittatus]
MQSTTNKMFDYPSIAATPELIFKMSKKIAQLTKVIYVVNLKNDLHHREVEEISNNFKLIIEQNNLQHKAEVLKLENYQKVLEEKNKNDVSQIQLDYHQRMGKMDQKYLENQKLWEIKWENAMNERQREITNFTSKLETLKNLLEQCQQEKKTNQSDHALQLEKYVSLASEFENATKILAGEKYLLENKIEAAEALHNERCKNMSENHQKEIETLKEKHYTDLCELQEGIRHQRALSDKKINEISTKLQEQCQQNDLLRKNVETLEAEKIRGKKKKEELENEMQHKLSALNAEVLELRKNSVQLLKEKSELNSEIERRGKENIELMMESKKQVEKLQNLLTSQRVEMNDETRHLLDTTTEKYEVKIEELKQRYEDLVIQFKNDKQAFENGILNKKIEIQSLSAKLLNLERNNITLLKEKDHEIISLKNKLEEQRQSLLENHELELKVV